MSLDVDCLSDVPSAPRFCNADIHSRGSPAWQAGQKGACATEEYPRVRVFCSVRSARQSVQGKTRSRYFSEDHTLCSASLGERGGALCVGRSVCGSRGTAAGSGHRQARSGPRWNTSYRSSERSQSCTKRKRGRSSTGCELVIAGQCT